MPRIVLKSTLDRSSPTFKGLQPIFHTITRAGKYCLPPLPPVPIYSGEPVRRSFERSTALFRTIDPSLSLDVGTLRSVCPVGCIHVQFFTGGICSINTPRKSSVRFGTASSPYRTLRSGWARTRFRYSTLRHVRQ